MTKQEITEKVQKLMEDEQFKVKLANAQDLDEMAALFQSEGIQVTGSDLEAAAMMSQDDEELDEEKLESVAGGLAPIIVAGIIIFVGGSLILGYVDGIKQRAKKCKLI